MFYLSRESLPCKTEIQRDQSLSQRKESLMTGSQTLWPLGGRHILGAPQIPPRKRLPTIPQVLDWKKPLLFRLDSCHWWLKAWKDTQEESKLKFLLNRSHSQSFWMVAESKLVVSQLEKSDHLCPLFILSSCGDVRGRWGHRGGESWGCWLYFQNACFEYCFISEVVLLFVSSSVKSCHLPPKYLSSLSPLHPHCLRSAC